MENQNANLNQLSTYRNEFCVDCGRKWPHTTLDIEAVIHHGGSFKCVDAKACRKVRKKTRKKRPLEKGLT